MASTRRFILIDPWLTGVGGHNYQYAADLLEAADSRGYQTVLVTNKRFVADAESTARQSLPLFDYQPTNRYWLGPDGKCKRPLSICGQYLTSDSNGNSFERLSSSICNSFDMRRRDRRRRIANYVDACRQLFQQIGWRTNDIVFLPSLSEFDFLGVARFLAETPASRQVPWHLQFHFNIFNGREHEYADQSVRLRRFRRQFEAARARILDHDLRFYCTTETIAEQYNRMRVAPFRALPYPVSAAIHPIGIRCGSGPLRVTCAGAVRREKGRRDLARLIRQLRHNLLDRGRLQLVIQADRGALSRILPSDMARQIEILPTPDIDCKWPVVPVSFPLDKGGYADLIRQSDIGLFMYDARRYYGRCSGVLVEMLAAGVPVVVPAGCWLADQLAEPDEAYLKTLLTKCAEEPLRRCEIVWQAKHDCCLQAEVQIPSGTAAAVFRFAQAPNLDSPRYIQVTTTERDVRRNQLTPARTTIVAQLPGQSCRTVMTKPNELARHVTISLSSAYGNTPYPLSWSEATFLSAPSPAAQRPRSAVGITVSSPLQVAATLAEMTDEYEHYRRTAEDFSEQWRYSHSAVRTIEILQRDDILSANTRAG